MTPRFSEQKNTAPTTTVRGTRASIDKASESTLNSSSSRLPQGIHPHTRSSLRIWTAELLTISAYSAGISLTQSLIEVHRIADGSYFHSETIANPESITPTQSPMLVYSVVGSIPVQDGNTSNYRQAPSRLAYGSRKPPLYASYPCSESLVCREFLLSELRFDVR